MFKLSPFERKKLSLSPKPGLVVTLSWLEFSKFLSMRAPEKVPEKANSDKILKLSKAQLLQELYRTGGKPPRHVL